MNPSNVKLPAEILFEKWVKKTPWSIFADFVVSTIPFKKTNLPFSSVDLYRILSTKIKEGRWINSFMMEVSIKQKPVDWFLEQINGLVSMW